MPRFKVAPDPRRPHMPMNLITPRDLAARSTAKKPAERPRGFAPICAALQQLLTVGDETTAAQPASAKAVRSPWRRIVASAALAVVGLAGTAFGLAWFGYHALEAELRASADAISASGIGADGLIKLDALRQFDKLRGGFEVVADYHRHGGPIGYRLGALVWGDLYGPARRLYFERFHAFFLGPVLNNQRQFLHALPGTPSAPYGSCTKR